MQSRYEDVTIDGRLTLIGNFVTQSRQRLNSRNRLIRDLNARAVSSPNRAVPDCRNVHGIEIWRRAVVRKSPMIAFELDNELEGFTANVHHFGENDFAVER
jgi:hypothetical protein